MPAILRIWCSSCELDQKPSESLTEVRLDDGSYRICPHPGEKTRAQRYTGEEWATLVARGRIRVSYGAFCDSCGHLGYYPLQPTLQGDFIRSITYRPPRAELQVITCASCAQPRLWPVTAIPSGEIPCPLCEHGRIQQELWGIS